MIAAVESTMGEGLSTKFSTGLILNNPKVKSVRYESKNAAYDDTS